jgi:hypothetical protein
VLCKLLYDVADTGVHITVCDRYVPRNRLVGPTLELVVLAAGVQSRDDIVLQGSDRRAGEHPRRGCCGTDIVRRVDLRRHRELNLVRPGLEGVAVVRVGVVGRVLRNGVCDEREHVAADSLLP